MSIRSLAWLVIAAVVVACADRGSQVEPPRAPATRPVEDAGMDASEPPAAPAESAAAEPPKDPCPSTPWSCYGHDPARTSASDGCVTGPLAITWRLTRKGQCGYMFRAGRFIHAI